MLSDIFADYFLWQSSLSFDHRTLICLSFAKKQNMFSHFWKNGWILFIFLFKKNHHITTESQQTNCLVPQPSPKHATEASPSHCDPCNVVLCCAAIPWGYHISSTWQRWGGGGPARIWCMAHKIYMYININIYIYMIYNMYIYIYNLWSHGSNWGAQTQHSGLVFKIKVLKSNQFWRSIFLTQCCT